MKINPATGSLKRQIIIALIINIFAGFANSGYFLFTGSLYHDTAGLYSFFHSNMQSLNYFGEPSWWLPQNQFGFPGYYCLMLVGMNSSSPVSIGLGLIFWLLGIIGIRIAHIQPIYVIYFGFLIPFLLSLAVLLMARQLAFSEKTIIFTLILTAFSPMLINLSDIGFLEPVAYSLYFAAAFLSFIKRPEKSKFWILCLSLLVICVSLNYTYLAWSIWFIPIFVALFLILKDGYSQKAKIAFTKINKWEISVFICLAILCLLPNFVVLAQGQEIVSAGVSSLQYSFLDMKGPGYPTEALFASVPRGGKGAPIGLGGYNYLGLLALPLAATGLLFGDFRKSWRIAMLFSVFFAIILMSAYSPIFGLLLYIVSPLRGMNHYHDLGYPGGGFTLIIAASALGFETLFGDRDVKFARQFALGALITSGLVASHIVAGMRGFGSSMYGFTLLMLFLFSISLTWLVIANSSTKKKAAIAYLILFLTFIDTSTINFIYVREAMYGKGEIYNIDILADNLIGMKDPKNAPLNTNSYANGGLFRLKKSMQLDSLDVSIDDLPRFGLFAKAHTYEDVPQVVDVKMIAASGSSSSSLAIEKQAAEIDIFKKFFDKAPPQNLQPLGTVELKSETYNSFVLNVSASESALLFIKDNYFPYWQATVNGNPTPIVRAIAAFKALAVPAGNSEVKLRFAPPAIGWLLLIAYIAILGTALWSIIISRPLFKHL